MAILSNLMSQVFSNELILDIILYHAIFPVPWGKIKNPSTHQVVRLVHSTWRQSVTRILKKRRRAFFELSLDDSNSITGQEYVKENGKLLDNFLAFVSSMSRDFPRLYSSFPPFGLDFHDSFLQAENFRGLLNFWTNPCVTGLVSVQIRMYGEIPAASLVPVFPKASFPLLGEMHFYMGGYTGDFILEDSQNVNLVNITSLVQAILNGVEDEKFEFSIDTDVEELPLAFVPTTFQYLSLPTTLGSFKLDGPLGSDILEGLLVRRPPPNLTSLALSFPKDCPFRDGLVFQILDVCKSTLVTLDFVEGSIPDLRFPVMKKLKHLGFRQGQFELEEEQRRPLERFLPQLEKIMFMNHSKSGVENFLKNSEFVNVKDLYCGLVGGDRKRIPLDLETMRIIHRGFPNVTKLSIRVPGMNTDALKYLFQEMKLLVDLTFEVANQMTIQDQDLWDSLITGLPIQLVQVLKTNPELTELINLQHEGYRGIRNLENLTHLYFRVDLTILNLDEKKDTVFSELAFVLGFLKMPELKELKYADYYWKLASIKTLNNLWKQRNIRA